MSLESARPGARVRRHRRRPGRGCRGLRPHAGPRGPRASATPSPRPSQTPVADVVDGPRIVFRHTGLDNELGVVAMVPLDDPGGARAFTGVSCDRVAARADGASCLTIDRGVVTTYEAHSYDADWQRGRLLAPARDPEPHPPLAGRHPRRDDVVRVGPLLHDGRLLHRDGGPRLRRQHVVGQPGEVRPRHRGPRRSARPTATSGASPSSTTRRSTPPSPPAAAPGWSRATSPTARSRRSPRTPSARPLSPDGSRVAFKVDVDPGRKVVWQVAVQDLATRRAHPAASRARGASTTRWSGSTTTPSSTGCRAGTSPA